MFRVLDIVDLDKWNSNVRVIPEEGKSMKKKTNFRFKMDTEAFVSIWAETVYGVGPNDWRAFVLGSFAYFSIPGLPGGKALAEEFGADAIAKWSEDDKYAFLSERCYNKCTGIRRKVKETEDYDIPMPDGYKSRGGKSASTRTTPARIKKVMELVRRKAEAKKKAEG